MTPLLISCKACGAGNRVPVERLTAAARCGRCKTPLPPLGEPLAVDERAFDAIVYSAKVPVLVDFWASWCGPCRLAEPEIQRLAEDMAGRALVLKIDTEAEPHLAGRFRVQSIPNFVVFANGRPVFQRAGAAPLREMRGWLETAAAESARPSADPSR